MNPAKLKRILSIAAVIIAIGLILLVTLVFLSPQEPFVGTTPLTDWMATNQVHPANGEEIAKLGAVPIPFLIQKLPVKETAMDSLYRNLWKKLPQKVKYQMPFPYRSEIIRKSALQLLNLYGKEAHDALPGILNLTTNNAEINNQPLALKAALTIGHDDRRVNKAFEHLLTAPGTRSEAAIAIYYSGVFPACAPSALLPLKIANTNQLPLNEILALSVMGPEASPAVPELIHLLEQPNQVGKGNLLIALSKIGPKAEAAVPVLLENLDTSTPMEQGFIIEAFMNIGPAATLAIPHLREITNSQDATLKALAAAAIATISGETNEPVSILVDVLKDPSSTGIGWRSPYRIPGIDHLLKSRQAAALLLGDLAPKSLPALPELKKMIATESNRTVKVLLARAIWQLEGDSGAVLPVLMEGLESHSDETRVFACLTLKEMGPEAMNAVPALMTSVEKSLVTRQAALAAIAEIE